MSAESYPFVRAWGKLMGSFDYYIKAQKEKAQQDVAPFDAIYRRDDGGWQTFRDVTRPDTIHQLERWIDAEHGDIVALYKAHGLEYERRETGATK